MRLRYRNMLSVQRPPFGNVSLSVLQLTHAFVSIDQVVRHCPNRGWLSAPVSIANRKGHSR
jgi:hypothetical protein